MPTAIPSIDQRRNIQHEFPYGSANIHLDYGRASFAIRDRVFFADRSRCHRFSSSRLVFNSGAPYNVTIPQDLPALCNSMSAPLSRPTNGCVRLCAATCHYISPTTPYDQIPINYLTVR